MSDRDPDIDDTTEKVTLLNVALMIDQVTDGITEQIGLATHRVMEQYLMISVDTLRELRTAMFTKFGYQEPAKLC